MSAGGLRTSSDALAQPAAKVGNVPGASTIASQGLGAGALPPQSRAGQLRALEGLAIARRDASGLERLGAVRQAADEDEFIAQALKGYTGDEDQIGATTQHLNSSSKSIAMSDPDKHGVVRVSVVTPDRRAQFLDLSRQDQARLYAAAQLMERNPAKAYEMMSGVNKSLADAIAAENGLTSKVAHTNNDAAFRARDDSRADQQLAESRRHNRASEAIAATRASGGSGLGAPGAFDPMAGFDHDKAYQSATAMVDKQMAGDLGGKADPKQRAARIQEAYASQRDAWAAENTTRQRSGAFANEARKAKTPAELEALRAKALERGYTDDEMVRLDPRFKKLDPGKPAPQATTASRAIAAAPRAVTPAALDPVIDSDAGNAYDAARQEFAAAREQARTFGLKQRRDSPTAYAAAMQRVRDAERAQGAAEQQWQSFIAKQGLGASFGGGVR